MSGNGSSAWRRCISTVSGRLSKALAARLAAFWLPSQTIVFIGSSERPSPGGWRRSPRPSSATGGRIPAVTGCKHAPVARRCPGLVGRHGRTRGVRGCAAGGLRRVGPDRRARRTSRYDGRPAVRQPASGRPASGRRRLDRFAHRRAGDAPAATDPIVQVPDGDAEGARGEPPPVKGRAPSTAATPARRRPRRRRPRRRRLRPRPRRRRSPR